jgi:LysM repeat protein
MMTRSLLFVVLATLLASHTLAADNGPSAHARGSFDAATGVYTAVSGDALGATAARFGMSLAEIDQQNALSSNQIQVGAEAGGCPA